MDFSVFPCRQAKKKPALPPPAPPPPKGPSFPACIPEFMQQLPRVPGSRNVEMLFRWNLGEDMDGYTSRGVAPGPFASMAPLSHHYMGLPPPPPPPPLLGAGMQGPIHPFAQGMHDHGPPLGYGMQGPIHPFAQGMHDHGPPLGYGMQEYDYPYGYGHGDYGFDPYGPPPPHHYGYY